MQVKCLTCGRNDLDTTDVDRVPAHASATTGNPCEGGDVWLTQPCKGCKGTGEVGRWRVSGGSRKWITERHKPCRGTGKVPASKVQRNSPAK